MLYNPYKRQSQDHYRGFGGPFASMLRESDQREKERIWNKTQFICSLDLGQVNDFSCLITLEPRLQKLHVRKIDRLRLGMSYPLQVEHVQATLGKLKSRRSLVIDHTGCGRPVFDMFKAAGLPVVGITLTSGEKTIQLMTKTIRGLKPRQEFRCPKITVISSLNICMQKRLLVIPKTLENVDILVAELKDFEAQAKSTGHVSFNAREGSHDDVLMSLALGCWWWLHREKYMIVRTRPMARVLEGAAGG